MTKTISTSVIIEREPREVWRVLTDFSEHPRWNPFIREIQGQPIVGSRLRVHISPPGGRGMVFRPRITTLVPEQNLVWLGRFLMPRLFDGRHSFTLRDLGDGRTELTQAETFTGILVPLLGHGLGRTSHGFELMNLELKRQCEGTAAPH